jgi:hypothetical protein
LKFHTPTRANTEYIAWILREAEWLGITGQGAISSFGRALIAGEELGVEKALPTPVDHILIQADNSAIAPGPLTLEISEVRLERLPISKVEAGPRSIALLKFEFRRDTRSRQDWRFRLKSS